MRIGLIAVAGLCASVSSAYAQIYNVPGSYPTIQQAINNARPGSTIIVAPGTYNEAIDFQASDVTLRSSGGSGVTTINGGAASQTIRIDERNSRALVIDGFRVIGGGIGIYGANCGPTIRNCVITGNIVGEQAVFIEQSAPLFENCTFSNNTNSAAGAVYVGGYPRPNPTFTGCTFTGNSVNFPGDPRGGAVGVYDGTATFEDCTFSNNSSASAGGAIHMRNEYSHLVLRRCTFTGNTAVEGGALEDIAYGSSDLLIESCTFNGNIATGGIGGGAIRLDAGSATNARVIRGSTFDANKSANGVSAIEVARAAGAGLLVEDCVFKNNTPNPASTGCCDGGPVRIRQNSVVSFTGSSFENNLGRGWSGGLWVQDSSVVSVSGCEFINNAGPYQGGALRQDGTSTLTVEDSLFQGNSALEGGAIASYLGATGSLTLSRCVFDENNAVSNAALELHGGVQSINGCQFTGNHATDGGAAVRAVDMQSFAISNSLIADNFNNCFATIYVANVVQPVTIENCTIASNTSNCGNQAGIWLDTPLTMSIRNSIIWGNGNTWETPPLLQFGGSATPSVQHSIVQYGYTGTGNTSTDPLFANAAAGDFRPREGSPAIDTGSNAAVTSSVDLNGVTRILDGDANGTAAVDRGAYEAKDCNANAVPDFRDIASGAASDANLNGVPDSCDDNFTVNLRTGTTYTSIASALAASQAGDELRAASLQFASPSFITFQNRLVTISSFDSITQGIGATLELTNGAMLSTATGKQLTVRGTMRTATNAGADVTAGSFTALSGSMLLARSNSSLSIGAASSSVAGSMRLDPNAVLTFGGSLWHEGSATLLAGSNLICDGGFNAANGSSLIATAATVVAGATTLSGTAQFSDSYIIAPSVSVTSPGAFTAYGEIYADFTNSGQSTFSRETRVFGDYTNNIGATTTIRSGTLYLFGSLTNNGTIIGTLCTNCLSTPPNMDIGGDLNIGAAADLNMAFMDSYVRTGGNFNCAINDNDRFDLSLASLRMERDSGSTSEQTLEVMSTDIGADVAGLDRTMDGHYPIGVLDIGAGSTVRLVDTHDNDGFGQESCEAIYVDQLHIASGAHLINTSCKIYYNTLDLQGTVEVAENLVAYGPTCAPCAADFDNNGGIDGADLGAFFSAYEAGETCGDVDQNGGIDGADLAYFFAVYEAGGC